MAYTHSNIAIALTERYNNIIRQTETVDPSTGTAVIASSATIYDDSGATLYDDALNYVWDRTSDL